jgi:GNAT superfamily N-acetyltransferase
MEVHMEERMEMTKETSLDIRKLTPALVDDYLRFFDQTPHSTNLDEHRCYCVCWSSDDDRSYDFSTAEKRRAMAATLVKGGRIQGYLAYQADQTVGWCNANVKSDCYECCSWRMFMGAIPRETEPTEARVKSVFCFAIAPHMRGKGVAGALLRQVCEDAERDGFDAVEAYPNKVFVDTEQDFMGPVSLFEKHGFHVAHEVDQKLVMRKDLR